MKKIVVILTLLMNLSCEDRFAETKYDVRFFVTNKTKAIIPMIKVQATESAEIKKAWIFKNVEAEKSEMLDFNVQRDFGAPEGGFFFTVYLNEKDSLTLNTGYFTNWQYQGSNPTNFNVYTDKIEEVK